MAFSNLFSSGALMLSMAAFIATIVYADDVSVATEFGSVVGESVEIGAYGTINTFKGIPFAKPPTGELRLLPPQEPESWTTPLETKAYGAACTQNNIYGYPSVSDDCLHLNVFAPAGGDGLAVMVWIHGGGLVNGRAEDYIGEFLSVYGEVVLVTIQYRLGITGFFSTGDEILKGNAGFLDQVMALKWVKNNIRNFGGDPDRVTIFGESAGGWSVSLLTLSPMAQGLFNKAIMQSGSLTGWPLTTLEDRKAIAAQIAATLGCATDDSAAMLECFQQKSAEELLAQEAIWGLAPTFGDEFLPEDPMLLLEKVSGTDIDIMAGLNSGDGLTVLGNVGYVPDTMADGVELDDPRFVGLQNTLYFMLGVGFFPAQDVLIKEAVMNYYFRDRSDVIQNAISTMAIARDVAFFAPTANAVKGLEAAGRNVYVYYFDQLVTPTDGTKVNYVEWQQTATANPDIPIGADHGAELSYIFGGYSIDIPFFTRYSKVGEADHKVGEMMMQAWTTFAKTGTPTFTADNGSEVTWPAHNSDEQYLHIKYPMTEDSIKTRIMLFETTLLTEIIPSMKKITVYESIIEELEEEAKNELEDEDDEVEGDKDIIHVGVKSTEDDSRENDTPKQGNDGTKTDGQCGESNVSNISLVDAELAMFILSAVTFVLLCITVIVLINYCSLKKRMKNTPEKRAVSEVEKAYAL